MGLISALDDQMKWAMTWAMTWAGMNTMRYVERAERS
jgi:hypothetical protein